MALRQLPASSLVLRATIIVGVITIMETIIYGLHDIQLPLYFSEILVFHLILYI
jgi:hypothetical protein